MSKNVIHDINIIIENNTDSKNSEQLSKDFLEQIALVIKEASEQKDTEQLMQEQQTITATAENTSTPTGEGAIASSKGQSATPSTAKSTTSSASGETTTTFSAPTGGGVTDNSEKPAMSLNASENTTPSVSEAENVGTDSFSGTTSETYESVASQQSVMVPQSIQQKRANGPSLELVKAEIKMKLHKAVVANDVEGIKEWTRILKAFSEGATIEDFYGKPNETLFTQMYDDLCKLNDVTQTFDWTVISKKMIEAIDAKILNGEITASGKKHWLEIKRQLKDEKTNIANLFEQYDELFLLLKEVEGLERLPGRITITTKTKVYPNLSADIVYADIGTESVYSFLKKVKNAEIQGAGVNKGAVKVKNSDATSFIVGESLDFVIDEVFVNQSLYSKENINWVVYKDNKMVGAPFVNEGLTFSYNFDKPGAYKIEAYGGKSGAAGGVVSSKLSKKKKAALKDANIVASAFVELRIVAQEIVITPPSNIYKGEKEKNDFARPFTAEKDFVISLKNNDVRSLNPITLYYQTSYTKVGGPIVKSEVKPLDTSGVIKMAMPELGAYSLEVFSKDQYGLTQSSSISILRNYVKDIEIIQGKKEYLMQNKERTMVLKAKSFKINPATEDEKANVKWVVYAKNGEKWDSYTPPGNAEPKGEKFDFSVPKKAGEYFIEAYNNTRDGLKSISSQKIEVIHPVVTEATWAFRSGSKKKTSGFGGESNWIKATIPHFANQKVRVLFFVNNEKEECYYSDTITNEAGEIDKFIAFDDKFKTRFGLQKGGTAKITFKLVGIVDGQIYTFKGAKYPKSNAVISVSSEEKILDLYFTYNGVRVTAQDRIPFGVKDPSPLSIVAKTQNMIGKEIAFTSHRLGGKSILGKLSKRKIDNAGVATVSYSIPEKKNLKKGETETYYAGIEGYSTKHIKDKAVVMQVGAVSGANGYGIDVDYFLEQYKGSNEANLKALLNDMNEYYTVNKISPRKEHVAYMLATVVIETGGTFKPIKEHGGNSYYEKMYDPVLGKSKKRRKMAVANGNTHRGDGAKYCGRGYVQLTWKNNYKKIKEQFGVDVVNYPDKVMEPKLAVKVMIWGMDKGIFSGVSIHRYVNDSKTDFVKARKVINGKDRANEIAEIAKNFNKKLRIIKDSDVNKPTANKPIIKSSYDLRNASKWQSQFDPIFGDKKAQNVSCLKACKMILQNYGVTGGTQAGKIQTALEEKGHLYIKDSREGVKYIDEQLKQNKPLVVGTDHTLNYGYNEGTTDHFIVIVGRGVENGVIFYWFYEVATSRKESGTHDKNRLYLQENFSLKGSPEYSKNRKYTVSQVRKNN